MKKCKRKVNTNIKKSQNSNVKSQMFVISNPERVRDPAIPLSGRAYIILNAGVYPEQRRGTRFLIFATILHADKKIDYYYFFIGGNSDVFKIFIV